MEMDRYLLRAYTQALYLNSAAAINWKQPFKRWAVLDSNGWVKYVDIQ